MKGNLLRAEIAAQGMSRREAAKRAGISKSTFCAKINGQRPFNIDEANRILSVLKITDAVRKCEIFLT